MSNHLSSNKDTGIETFKLVLLKSSASNSDNEAFKKSASEPLNWFWEHLIFYDDCRANHVGISEHCIPELIMYKIEKSFKMCGREWGYLLNLFGCIPLKLQYVIFILDNNYRLPIDSGNMRKNLLDSSLMSKGIYFGKIWQWTLLFLVARQI